MVSSLLSLLTLTLTGILAIFFFSFKSAENTRAHAQSVAKAAAAAATTAVIHKGICPLVNGYATLGTATTGTPQNIARSKENAANWAELGVVLNCSKGK